PYGVGADRRDNALCPSCHTMERHRQLWLYLERQTNIFTKPMSLLHFAPEPILQKRLKKVPMLEYISADLYSPLAMEQVDIMAMPYPDQRFDVILCSHVLAHVPDDRLGMEEMRRVLKTGGYAIIQSRINELQDKTIEAPEGATEAERYKLLGQADRFRNYGLDHTERLESAGFKVKTVDIRQYLKPEEVKLYGIDTNELLYICQKQ
ncbi:MAG: methyltransferase domain-containing protein, partial [Hymenobacteraceae bacterium]|nr:methyltransferase domain-containing protein [Hymenobacteraceae bacterium]MDX5395003.1 methyltransferase domain-containing protein [Hymenobacteraceae bacterium]MDX5443189.1 methyltransferase domain-containing protein [Hymenobacteraceae bacterium]MDX5511036.1 methyltransferase domain-containing protein [Hymenobacteraceae bacterium]